LLFHKDAFGVYIIEALASGVPLALPRHGAFPEILELTGGGILCEPNDANSLATDIEKLLLEPEYARDLGEKGRKVVTENFTIERMSQEIAELFQKTINR